MNYRSKNLVILFGMLAIAGLLYLSPCTSADITVSSDGSGDYRSIQEAVNVAGDGESIEVYQGDYKGFNFSDKYVRINGIGKVSISPFSVGSYGLINGERGSLEISNIDFDIYTHSNRNPLRFNKFSKVKFDNVTYNGDDKRYKEVNLDHSTEIDNFTLINSNIAYVEFSYNGKINNSFISNNQFYYANLGFYVCRELCIYQNNDLIGGSLAIIHSNPGLNIIKNCSTKNTPVNIQSSNTNIYNSLFNKSTISISGNPNIAFYQNSFFNSTSQAIWGKSTFSGIINDNIFFQNPIAIHLKTPSGSDNSFLHINNNKFYENIRYAVFVEAGDKSVDARFNWWGEESGPYHWEKNSAGLGNVVSNNVDFNFYYTDHDLKLPSNYQYKSSNSQTLSYQDFQGNSNGESPNSSENDEKSSDNQINTFQALIIAINCIILGLFVGFLLMKNRNNSNKLNNDSTQLIEHENLEQHEETVKLSCSNCSETIKVPKISGMQSVVCNSCGTSGKVEL